MILLLSAVVEVNRSAQREQNVWRKLGRRESPVCEFSVFEGVCSVAQSFRSPPAGKVNQSLHQHHPGAHEGSDGARITCCVFKLPWASTC